MSVRATERLIGDAVIVTALPKGPQMVVKAINEETKIITTAWFTADNEYQQGAFPAASLDRAEAKLKSIPKNKPAPKKQNLKTRRVKK